MFLYHVMRDVFFKKCRKKGSFLVHASNSHSVCLSHSGLVLSKNTVMSCLDVRVPLELLDKEIVWGEETLQPLPVYHDGRSATGLPPPALHCLLCWQRSTKHLPTAGLWPGFIMHYSLTYTEVLKQILLTSQVKIYPTLIIKKKR